MRRITGEAHAEDVLSEVYLQVWRGLAGYDVSRGQPLAWLVTIARSRALDKLRCERRSHGGQLDAPADTHDEEGHEIGPEPDPHGVPTISFLTNTDQQHYSGETTYSYFAQMLGLGFAFFTSSATGIAVAIAFIRGLTGRPLGNFYVDLTQAITRILLPISIVGTIVLVAAGTPETLAGAIVVPTLPMTADLISSGIMPPSIYDLK